MLDMKLKTQMDEALDAVCNERSCFDGYDPEGYLECYELETQLRGRSRFKRLPKPAVTTENASKKLFYQLKLCEDIFWQEEKGYDFGNSYLEGLSSVVHLVNAITNCICYEDSMECEIDAIFALHVEFYAVEVQRYLMKPIQINEQKPIQINEQKPIQEVSDAMDSSGLLVLLEDLVSSNEDVYSLLSSSMMENLELLPFDPGEGSYDSDDLHLDIYQTCDPRLKLCEDIFWQEEKGYDFGNSYLEGLSSVVHLVNAITSCICYEDSMECEIDAIFALHVEFYAVEVQRYLMKPIQINKQKPIQDTQLMDLLDDALEGFLFSSTISSSQHSEVCDLNPCTNEEDSKLMQMWDEVLKDFRPSLCHDVLSREVINAMEPTEVSDAMDSSGLLVLLEDLVSSDEDVYSLLSSSMMENLELLPFDPGGVADFLQVDQCYHLILRALPLFFQKALMILMIYIWIFIKHVIQDSMECEIDAIFALHVEFYAVEVQRYLMKPIQIDEQKPIQIDEQKPIQGVFPEVSFAHFIESGQHASSAMEDTHLMDLLDDALEGFLFSSTISSSQHSEVCELNPCTNEEDSKLMQMLDEVLEDFRPSLCHDVISREVINAMEPTEVSDAMDSSGLLVLLEDLVSSDEDVYSLLSSSMMENLELLPYDPKVQVTLFLKERFPVPVTLVHDEADSLLHLSAACISEFFATVRSLKNDNSAYNLFGFLLVGVETVRDLLEAQYYHRVKDALGMGRVYMPRSTLSMLSPFPHDHVLTSTRFTLKDVESLLQQAATDRPNVRIDVKEIATFIFQWTVGHKGLTGTCLAYLVQEQLMDLQRLNSGAFLGPTPLLRTALLHGCIIMSESRVDPPPSPHCLNCKWLFLQAIRTLDGHVLCRPECLRAGGRDRSEYALQFLFVCRLKAVLRQAYPNLGVAVLPEVSEVIVPGEKRSQMCLDTLIWVGPNIFKFAAELLANGTLDQIRERMLRAIIYHNQNLAEMFVINFCMDIVDEQIVVPSHKSIVFISVNFQPNISSVTSTFVDSTGQRDVAVQQL
ncbi:hypothetical protein L7F22_040503 [Adiantum nelumboides]|nr:hypothetical protein [Adiantum nelumboides]